MLEVQKKVCAYITERMKKLGLKTKDIQDKDINPFSLSSTYINSLLAAEKQNRVFQMSRDSWKKILKEANIDYIENLEADIFYLKKLRKDIRKEIKNTYLDPEELKDIACRLNVRPAELKRYLEAKQIEKLKYLL